jgi:nitrile hydratase subunit beta
VNGAHDLGGMHGFGPVEPEPDEPVFHAAWERRVFALAMAMGFTGAWTLDGSRAARESLPPADYLSSTYYEIWLKALENQLLDHGLVSRSELVSGSSEDPPKSLSRRLQGDAVAPLFRKGFPSSRAPAAPARYNVGDHVRVRDMNPLGHTRAPRYVRNRIGIVERIHDAFVFPDANAKSEDAPPQWLYSVGFAADGLWGEDAPPATTVVVAVFESYLQPVTASP